MEQLAKSGIGGILDYAAEDDVESGGCLAAPLSALLQHAAWLLARAAGAECSAQQPTCSL